MTRLLLLPVAALLLSLSAPCAWAQSAPSRQLAQMPSITFPPAPAPIPDQLIVPPQENTYFPTRPDGQAFKLNEDLTVNFTDQLNRYYFNPHWRGEEWAPFQNYWIVERAVRLMPTWDEYDQFSTWKPFWHSNKIHKFFERYSGYGP